MRQKRKKHFIYCSKSSLINDLTRPFYYTWNSAPGGHVDHRLEGGGGGGGGGGVEGGGGGEGVGGEGVEVVRD